MSGLPQPTAFNTPTVHQMPFPDETVEFDQRAFDNRITYHGVRMEHYMAMRSPVGMVNVDDIRKPGTDHSGNSNGLVYKKAGELVVLFSGMNKREQQNDAGLLDGSTVRVTFPRFYEDSPTKPVSLFQYDRLYLSETNEPIVVPNWQLFEAHEIGIEKLNYPLKRVVWVVDADGVEYNESDYSINRNGQLVWEGRRPRPGTVVGIRYEYTPFWYVLSMDHEIRVATKYTGGVKSVDRMPQSALLQREYIFENEANDPKAIPESARQTKAPKTGSFGPR